MTLHDDLDYQSQVRWLRRLAKEMGLTIQSRTRRFRNRKRQTRFRLFAADGQEIGLGYSLWGLEAVLSHWERKQAPSYVLVNGTAYRLRQDRRTPVRGVAELLAVLANSALLQEHRKAPAKEGAVRRTLGVG